MYLVAVISSKTITLLIPAHASLLATSHHFAPKCSLFGCVQAGLLRAGEPAVGAWPTSPPATQFIKKQLMAPPPCSHLMLSVSSRRLQGSN